MARHPLHRRPDTTFGRFAANMVIVAVIFCLGCFGLMWYLSDSTGKIKMPEFNSSLSDSSIAKFIPEKYRKLLEAKPPSGQGYLFYSKDGCTLDPIIVQLPRKEVNAMSSALQLLDALVKNRGIRNMQPTLPKGTTVKSAYLNDQTLIVNLSREFTDNMEPGMNAEILAVYGIVNTLMVNIDTISSVRLLIEGESLPVARTDVDISGNLIANMAILSD